MDFVISYRTYQDVSIHDDEDALEVRFVGNQYFRSEDTKEFIEQSVAIVKKSVPSQVDPSTASVVAAATSAMSSSSQAFVIVNFVINIFAGGAL
jgi:Golgi nucleoside diphosphatase